MGVGVEQVEGVITSVLKNIAKVKLDSVPKSTFSRLMYTEARGLSQIQVAESLLESYESSARTLHTDGTSKSGTHYGTYDIVRQWKAITSRHKRSFFWGHHHSDGCSQGNPI